MNMAEEKKGDMISLGKAAGMLRRLWPFVRPQWPQFALVLLGICLDAAGNAARLWVIARFVQSEFVFGKVDDQAAVQAQQALGDFLPLAGILMLGALAMATGSLLKQYFTGYVQARTIINLQRAVLGRVLSQPMTYFNAQRKGTLITRLTANTAGAGSLLRTFIEGVLAGPAVIVALGAVMFYTSPSLSLLTLVTIPAVLVPVIVYAAKIRKATRTKYRKLEASGNFFLQTLDGIRVVKGYRLEGAQREEFERVSDQVFLKERKVARYKGLSRFGIEITYNGVMAAALLGAGLVMATQWFEQMGGIGTFVAFFAGLLLLYDPARKLGHSLNDIQESTSALEAVFETHDREPEIADMHGAREAPHDFAQIAFEHVTFEYAPGRPVLRDVDFKVGRGQMVAFVGGSGMGKSTLMDLIPRFYDPVEGRICVDGTDLREFRLESWLRNIAIVSQETFLFNTTIRQNILCGKPDASEDELIQAARAAHIWEEIRQMPQGLDTPLGERGVNLSGGQRQRVAIARAFLRKAPILLLDEATSSLDSASEREVQLALDELIHGCTVFAIAHRLSTIRGADMILVFSHGRIVESGSHEELMQLNGQYAAAVRMQQGEFEEIDETADPTTQGSATI